MLETTAAYKRTTPNVFDGSFASIPGNVACITNSRNCPTPNTPTAANVSDANKSGGATSMGRSAEVNTLNAAVSWCVAVPCWTASAKRDMTSGSTISGSIYARSRVALALA
jgi:hypothetical protein